KFEKDNKAIFGVTLNLRTVSAADKVISTISSAVGLIFTVTSAKKKSPFLVGKTYIPAAFFTSGFKPAIWNIGFKTSAYFLVTPLMNESASPFSTIIKP